jgi:hypothetical protein
MNRMKVPTPKGSKITNVLPLPFPLNLWSRRTLLCHHESKFLYLFCSVPTHLCGLWTGPTGLTGPGLRHHYSYSVKTETRAFQGEGEFI